MSRRWSVLFALAVLLVLTACSSSSTPWTSPSSTSPDGVVRTDVALGSVTLHVRVSGPLGAPPVVLVHGFPETGAAWDAVAADLAADHRVVVPDLRGVGRSSLAPGEPDGTKRALAADLALLVERLELPPATVVGHDLGAMTALAWGRARPDQVSRLVLTGGGVPGFGLLERGPPHLGVFGAAPPGELARGLAGRERAFLDGFISAGAGPAASTPEVRRLVDDAVAAYRPPERLDAAFAQYRALVRDARDNRAVVGPLDVPVVVVADAPDDLTTTTVSPLAPARRVVVVPGGGHFLPTTHPREVAAAIRSPA